MNYKNLEEVVVTTQKELDDIPLDFKGRIYIKSSVRIVVTNKYYFSVVAWENSSVVAWENSSVEAWENSSVVARENSSVVARGNSSVVAWENSSVVAWENSSVVAWGNSSVEARENSSVVARGNSSVVAWENSSVVARGNSSVVAWGNSSVEARGNSQIVDRLSNGKIQINGNARIVYMPKNINDFMDFYGIKHTKTKATFYKAVRKKDDVYVSDYDKNFIYTVGKTISLTEINTDVECNCGAGLHISHLHWALDFGSSWNDLAILECETKIADIVMPKNTNGKVRTSKLKVIREIPLEECGTYGKILAKRIKK